MGTRFLSGARTEIQAPTMNQAQGAIPRFVHLRGSLLDTWPWNRKSLRKGLKNAAIRTATNEPKNGGEWCYQCQWCRSFEQQWAYVKTESICSSQTGYVQSSTCKRHYLDPQETWAESSWSTLKSVHSVLDFENDPHRHHHEWLAMEMVTWSTIQSIFFFKDAEVGWLMILWSSMVS